MSKHTEGERTNNKHRGKERERGKMGVDRAREEQEGG